MAEKENYLTRGPGKMKLRIERLQDPDSKSKVMWAVAEQQPDCGVAWRRISFHEQRREAKAWVQKQGRLGDLVKGKRFGDTPRLRGVPYNEHALIWILEQIKIENEMAYRMGWPMSEDEDNSKIRDILSRANEMFGLQWELTQLDDMDTLAKTFGGKGLDAIRNAEAGIY